MSRHRVFRACAALLLAAFCTQALVLNAQSPQSAAAELNRLADTERAFAAKSVAEGMRAAFLEYFAPDGINFAPHPVNTRESLGARPAPPSKPPITLDWWPVFGDISLAGDLGYTTGPFVLKDTRENDKIVGQGFYFSVWKKQPDGSWRVAVDYGSEIPQWLGDKTPRDFHAAHWVGTPPKGRKPHSGAAGLADPVLARDRAFADRSLRGGTMPAYREFTSWDDETRLYRDQMNPLLGRQAISQALGNLKVKFTWQALAGGTAASGDLAYTYGKWQTTDRANRSGYYVRVWRHIKGDWRVVAEVMNPLPSQ